MNKKPPHFQLITSMLNALKAFSVDANRNCTGSSVIEKDNGDDPAIVLYATYANGDYMVWFGDAGKLHLYYLVNDTMKHAGSWLMSQQEELQKQIDELKLKLGKKKK